MSIKITCEKCGLVSESQNVFGGLRYSGTNIKHCSFTIHLCEACQCLLKQDIIKAESDFIGFAHNGLNPRKGIV
jgi:hypothetical protein